MAHRNCRKARSDTDSDPNPGGLMRPGLGDGAVIAVSSGSSLCDFGPRCGQPSTIHKPSAIGGEKDAEFVAAKLNAVSSFEQLKDQICLVEGYPLKTHENALIEFKGYWTSSLN
jgi:hypothetical protein